MMIRMLLEGMLDDLGHTVAGEAGAIDFFGPSTLAAIQPSLAEP